MLVAHDNLEGRTLTLLTSVPLLGETAVSRVYSDWRLYSRIEHGYRTILRWVVSGT
jgi:hypothetical protein